MLFGLHREIGYIPSSYLRAYIEYIGAENFKADYGNLNSQFRAHILDGILINKDWEAAKALSEAGINFKKELEAVRENTIHVSRMKENAFATYFSLPPAKQRDFLDSHPDLRTRHPNAVEFNLGLWAGRQDDYLDFPEKVGSFEPRTRAESLALIEENYPGLIATLAGDVD